MSARTAHPWLLLAPWYRWAQPGVPQLGRATAPVFQKYAAPSFVADFLAEPQRSLRFVDEDFVHAVHALSPRPKRSLSNLVRTKTDRRKIFLDTHGRFYLVVCELHCDAPGLPAVGRDQVCEAGFVVRRRLALTPPTTPAAPGARKALQTALAEVAALETQAATLRGLVPTTRGGKRLVAAVAEAIEARGAHDLAAVEADLAFQRRSLRDLAARHGVALALEGWVPSEHKGIGAWTAVEETPARIVEEILPLYPLIPDPAAVGHSAAGKTIYFGVLPTGSSDLDALGNPRFDDRTLYEVRCFVRRHDPCCPKKPTRGDCKGEIVWSPRTEAYQLAAATDLSGTSHKPVTIQLPDLPALEAQAAAMKVGEGVGVRMVSPAKSSLEFKTDADGKPTATGVGGAAICSFAIPLITIVATFVLKLFLPVVVLAFQLWFLLKLKFCIPPSFELDAGLTAELSIEGDLDVALAADIDVALEANLGAKTAAGISADLGGDVDALGAFTLEMGSDFSASAPADVAADFEPQKPGFGGPKLPLPSLTANLSYYDRVEIAS